MDPPPRPAGAQAPTAASEDDRTSEGVIRLSTMDPKSKLARKLSKVDQNKDGILDMGEVAAVVDEMLKEQAIGKIYKFMTIGLFIVCAVLIGALTGITYAIVQLSKDTKVTDNTGDYRFLVTKEDKPTVLGGPVLDLSSRLALVPENGTTNMTLPLTTGSGRRRLIAMSDFNQDLLVPYGQIDFPTVQAGCQILGNGLKSFLIATPSNVIDGGSTNDQVTILAQTGCDDPASQEVTALLSVAGLQYLLYCKPSNDPNAAQAGISLTLTSSNAEVVAGKCGVWLDQSSAPPPSETVDATTGGTRRVLGGCAFVSKGGFCTRCKSGWEMIAGACYQGCFPAEATVEVLGRGLVHMDELQYGDLVRSRDRTTGAVVHRPVYFFGHRDADAVGPYVHISAAGRTVAATSGHFVPVCVRGCTAEKLGSGAAVLEDRRAGGIHVGDIVLVSDPEPVLATVSEVDVMMARGLYNPLIRGADLIVDGVVASPHSNWILDPITPPSMVRHLPAVYEIMMAPLYGIYLLVGPSTGEWLAHGLGLAEAAAGGGLASGLLYAAALAAVSAPLVAAMALGRAASKRLLPRCAP